MCHECGKKYKTRGGFQRHIAAKHGQQKDREEMTLTPGILGQIVCSAVLSIKENKVFSPSIRNELDLYSFEDLQATEFSEIRGIFDGFVRNGDTEKFYGKYYASIPLKSSIFFKPLSRNTATVLSFKVADCMLAYHRREKEKSASESCNDCHAALSEREKAGLQYVGGYVLHKLHGKHFLRNSVESQQAMAILKAGKLETSDRSQKLIASVNRGGLWSITEHVQKIFLKAEQHFRQLTVKPDIQRVDICGITQKTISDCDVLCNYNLILCEAELEPVSHISKEVLHSIVSLYVRVRAFSFAKDFIQRYKVKAKQTKAKSLRREISRSCQETEQRQE